jgi:hypothetical protein
MVALRREMPRSNLGMTEEGVTNTWLFVFLLSLTMDDGSNTLVVSQTGFQ